MGDRWQRGAMAGYVAVVVAVAASAYATAPGATDPAKAEVLQQAPSPATPVPLVRVTVIRLGGGSETYELSPSDHVVHATDWDRREFDLPAGSVRQLEQQLRACRVCSLEPSQPIATGPSRRRIQVDMLGPPKACWVNLPWELWHSKPAAIDCLRPVATALKPLIEQCPECTVPSP